jgi:hypothetical protein
LPVTGKVQGFHRLYRGAGFIEGAFDAGRERPAGR